MQFIGEPRARVTHFHRVNVSTSSDERPHKLSVIASNRTKQCRVPNGLQRYRERQIPGEVNTYSHTVCAEGAATAMLTHI